MGFIKDIFGGATPKSDPTITTDLKVEETKKKKARQAALASLNPTGSLGAGTPETTRRTTLGV